eukprot:UN07925
MLRKKSLLAKLASFHSAWEFSSEDLLGKNGGGNSSDNTPTIKLGATTPELMEMYNLAVEGRCSIYSDISDLTPVASGESPGFNERKT